jgi:hypothetical protein
MRWENLIWLLSSDNVLHIYEVKITDMLELNVAQRRFFIWKLELWWIAFDKAEFYPEGRKHLKGNWFWRQ